MGLCNSKLVIPLVCFGLLLHVVASADEPGRSGQTEAGRAVRELSAALRDTIDAGPNSVSFKMRHEENWNAETASDRSVILVPGLFANQNSMALIRRALQSEKIPTATFLYDDQLPIDIVAEGLSAELARCRQDEPQRPITMITHSLGGIVARAAIETDGRSPHSLDQLIMIAPPNHGSALADLSANEISEFVGSLGGERIDLSIVNDAINGFVGEAKESLRPSSAFLSKLNSCARVKDVDYAIIAGIAGPIHRELIQLPMLLTDLILGVDPDREKAMAPIERIASTDEWIVGYGDGVVSVTSARLSGVDDFTKLSFLHNDLCENERRASSTGRKANLVIATVMDRLRQKDR